MKNNLLAILLGNLLPLIAFAQNTGAGSASGSDKANMLVILTLVTGVVVVAAVFIVLRAITTLSSELRKKAIRK
ncbi:MAG: hypothetical protein IPM47_10320 [Sphingobacteriales bacterium]|nr:MAG: hypothetical protein IPM47_10320 [Sphingobacteriales bacterium]